MFHQPSGRSARVARWRGGSHAVTVPPASPRSAPPTRGSYETSQTHAAVLRVNAYHTSSGVAGSSASTRTSNPFMAIAP